MPQSQEERSHDAPFVDGHGRLQGEVAIITGATSGLGRHLAIRFAQEGAKVVLTGRNSQRGEAVCQEIAQAVTSPSNPNPGNINDTYSNPPVANPSNLPSTTRKASPPPAIFVAADFTSASFPSVNPPSTDPPSTGLPSDSWAEEITKVAINNFGKLTILVNNAVDLKGDGPVSEVTARTWEHILSVNVVAAGLLCGAATDAMSQTGGGSILNISSRTAERSSPRLAAYTASKGALNALTRSIALDYAHLKIRCNTIQLGYVLHETRDAANSPARQNQIEEMGLLRPTTPEDVCHACVYLASRESEAITGITLRVDSGSTAARATSFDSVV